MRSARRMVLFLAGAFLLVVPTAQANRDATFSFAFKKTHKGRKIDADCTGTWIGKRAFVTAAHCLDVGARSGGLTSRQGGEFPVGVVVHDNWKDDQDHDIAVVVYDRDVTRAVSPIGFTLQAAKVKIYAYRNGARKEFNSEIKQFIGSTDGKLTKHIYDVKDPGLTEGDSGGGLFLATGELAGVLRGCAGVQCGFLAVLGEVGKPLLEKAKLLYKDSMADVKLDLQVAQVVPPVKPPPGGVVVPAMPGKNDDPCAVSTSKTVCHQDARCRWWTSNGYNTDLETKGRCAFRSTLKCAEFSLGNALGKQLCEGAKPENRCEWHSNRCRDREYTDEEADKRKGRIRCIVEERWKAWGSNAARQPIVTDSDTMQVYGEWTDWTSAVKGACMSCRPNPKPGEAAPNPGNFAYLRESSCKFLRCENAMSGRDLMISAEDVKDKKLAECQETLSF